MNPEINEIISYAVKLYHSISNTFLGKREISTETKITVYKATIFRSVLTYGSESWILSSRMKTKIEAIDMKYLRVGNNMEIENQERRSPEEGQRRPDMPKSLPS